MKELFMTSPVFPVFLAAVDLEMPPAPRSGTVPSLSPHLTPGVAPVTTSKAECASKWNGLHSPVSLKPRLNLSIEVPSPSQVCVHGCRHEVSPRVALQQECDFSSPVTAENGKKGYLSEDPGVHSGGRRPRPECFPGGLPLLQVVQHG